MRVISSVGQTPSRAGDRIVAAPTVEPLLMPASRLNPEQRARVRIDELLEAAGWLILDYADADFAAGPGVAIRELMTPTGPMDYLLVAGGKVVGSIEAKKEGDTLRQVEVQSDRYADGFEKLVKTRNLPPYHYISTGTETLFTSRRDPIRRPREVFHFHNPETLAGWAVEPVPYRARLRQLPPLNAKTCAMSRRRPSRTWRPRSPMTGHGRWQQSRWAAARRGSQSQRPTAC
jgi:type I site-specific restriction endonuclease